MPDYISTSRLIDLSAREVHELYKLRVDIFVAEQTTPYAEIDDIDTESTTWHLLARKDGSLIGTARVFPRGDDCVIGRFAVAPDHRGSGVARLLFEEALKVAAERAPGRDVVLEAQAPLVDYYAGFGFEAEGEPYDDTGVPHQLMRLKRS